MNFVMPFKTFLYFTFYINRRSIFRCCFYRFYFGVYFMDSSSYSVSVSCYATARSVCKLHDANVTQPTSIGYLCVAESTTRLPSSVIKPSNVCNNLRILLVYSRHIGLDSRVFWGHLRLTLLSTQSPSTNIAARRFSWCAPTVWNSLPSFVCTADSFTSFRSQLKTYMFARHFLAAVPLSAPLIPLPGLWRVINSLLTYLLMHT